MKKENIIRTGNQELRKRLPRGAIKALSEKYNYSWIWIYKVVTGQANGDPRIIADACHLADIEDVRNSALAQIMKTEVVIPD
jgi:hypothetical protein